MNWTSCRSGSVSLKVIYLTKGGLGFHELEIEESAEVIVVNGTRAVSTTEFSRIDEGPNVL